MPRPALRRKHFPQQPRQTARVAKAIAKSPAISPQEVQRRLAEKEIGTRPVDSDDSDRLVTARKGKPNVSRLGKLEIYASGGLGVGDQPLAHKVREARNTDKGNLKGAQTALGGVASPLAQVSRPKSPLTNGVALSPEPRAAPGVHPPAAPSALARWPLATGPLSVAGTPRIGASILGSVKPRRRQASILHHTDTPDSSSFNFDGDSVFLPDAESTPVNLSKNTVASPPASLSPNTNPRKRKITPLAPPPANPESFSASSSRVAPQSTSPVEEPQLPHLSMSSKKPRPEKRRRLSDDIMAPPDSSSSPAPSPVKTHAPANAKPKRSRAASTTKPLTTQALLQSLMPRRQQARKYRDQDAGEFDLSPDSQSSDPLDDQETSFLPAGKPRTRTAAAARRKGAPSAATTKTGAKRRKEGTTSTLIPIKARASTPLSRSAKSPSQQPTGLSTRNSTAKPNASTAKVKSGRQCGPDSRPRRPANAGSVDDKENAPSGSSGGPDFSDGEDSEGDGGTEVGGELGALRRKFREIDDWDMEFEDVTVGRLDVEGSSDIMMR